jgi:hypothetical protein
MVNRSAVLLMTINKTSTILPRRWNSRLIQTLQILHDFNYASCFVWVVFLASHMKGRTMTVDVQGQGAQEIFEPKKEETRGGWRKLLNEEQHDLCNICSTIKVMKTRKMRWAGYIACTGEKKNAYKVLVVKPEPG